jgi:hypothetical protein
MMKFRKWVVALSASFMGLLLTAGTANAALDPAIKTAIETAGTDLKEAGAAVVIAIAAFWAIRKVGQKLGMW